MRGILACAAYLPHWRLQRSEIQGFAGAGGGKTTGDAQGAERAKVQRPSESEKGTRSVASFDEDTTTLAVEACRNLGAEFRPDALWFATAEPAYLDKSNAATIHAALRLDPQIQALDLGGALRSGVGSLKAALEGNGKILVAASDIRTGLPTSADEANAGDGAAALLVGEGETIASYLGGASLTREVVERWRSPGDQRSRTWEERFGESVYVPLGEQTFAAALKSAGVESEDVDLLCVAGMHQRSVSKLARKLGSQADDLSTSVGVAGTAQASLLLVNTLENAEPGKVVALVSLGDGADVLLFRAQARPSPTRSVSDQVASAADVPYVRFLSWRGMFTPEPPNRPEPARTSAPAADRAADWKYGLVQDDRLLAGEQGTIATFTIDRLVYSPSPPVVFAIVDLDGGTRLPLELTDVEADKLQVGDRIEMTFRRLSTADGIHNYFWKGRPLR